MSSLHLERKKEKKDCLELCQTNFHLFKTSGGKKKGGGKGEQQKPLFKPFFVVDLKKERKKGNLDF